MLSQYNQRIKDQLQADVIEKLEQPEVGQVHYLPHRPVIRNDKQTSKVRIVCDASSKIGNSPSLSDCLLPGPSLTESLFSVSIRFRLHRYAFLQILKRHSYKSCWRVTLWFCQIFIFQRFRRLMFCQNKRFRKHCYLSR